MVAGTIAGGGYFMGDNLTPPKPANPQGFFEGSTVRVINEDLLSCATPSRPSDPISDFFRERPRAGATWLARIPLDATMTATSPVANRIRAQLRRTPFAYKDVRFCYTLPVWHRYLPVNTVIICVFREPARTVNSILNLLAERQDLNDVRMNFSSGVRLWTLMYEHLFKAHDPAGRWLFVHYDQMLNGVGVQRLESALGTRLDHGFADPRYKRSPASGVVPEEARGVYARLCELASYEP